MTWLAFLPTFLLVFVRMTAFVVAAPVFTNQSIPAPFKIGFSFFLSLIAFSLVDPLTVTEISGMYLLYVVKEAAVGLSLGFICALFLYAVQVAGGLIDLQIGFAIANVFDPQTGIMSPITGRFKYTFAILLLLALNGHHLMIEGVLASYRWIAVNQWLPAILEGQAAAYVAEAFNRMFRIAFMIAAPVVGSVFLADVAIGIVARTVPQMNVFVVGLPVKIFTSMLVLLVVLPGFFYMLEKLFKEMIEAMQMMIRILGA